MMGPVTVSTKLPTLFARFADSILAKQNIQKGWPGGLAMNEFGMLCSGGEFLPSVPRSTCPSSSSSSRGFKLSKLDQRTRPHIYMQHECMKANALNQTAQSQYQLYISVQNLLVCLSCTANAAYIALSNVTL